MAFGSKEMALENARVVAKLEAQVDTLELRLSDSREESKELRGMLSRAQDALIAKEAPEAYRDQKAAEWEADHEPTEEEKEELKRRRIIANIHAQHLDNLEGPLFKNAEDMIAILSHVEGTPQSASLHNNSES